MDLTKAEDTKKSWRDYRKELYKNDFHDLDNQDIMIIHLEPHILEFCMMYSSYKLNKQGDNMQS